MLNIFVPGNFPCLQVHIDDTNIREAAEVTEVQAGEPDNDMVSLWAHNRPSTPFRLSELNPTVVFILKLKHFDNLI